MSSSRSPWPGLAGMDPDPREGPSTNNPRFGEEPAADQSHMLPQNAVPYQDPKPATPAPVAPTAPPTPAELARLLLVDVQPGEYGKYVVTLSPFAATKPYTADERAASDAFERFEQAARSLPWQAFDGAKAAYLAGDAGRRYQEQLARVAEARAELKRIDADLTATAAAWATAAGAGDDQGATRLELEREDLARQFDRVKVRLSVLERALADLRAAAEAGLPAAIDAAKAAYIPGAEERERAAREKLVAAVKDVFPAWLAAWAELHAARSAGSAAALIYSRSKSWEKLRKLG